MKRLTPTVVILLFSIILHAQNYQPNWNSLDSRPTPQWFLDAKFGIFVHWGVYSVPAWAPANADIGVYAKYAEWYWSRINDDSEAGKLFRAYHNKTYGEKFQYQEFAPDFKAQYFEPDEWAKLFKEAGAKYVVLTSKHHDGFALWPSEQSWNWNSMDVGPHRDLCGELSQSVKNAGLHMGFYYSLYEWFNPMYQNNLPKYVDDHMLPQMKDLITRYQPDILWGDGEWNHPSKDWKTAEFMAWLYNDSPVKDNIVINDRWGKETRTKHGGFLTTEYDLVPGQEGLGEITQPWEECRGIGTSFGYNQVEDLHNYLSSKALIDLLVEKVASGGNLLLNVGPTASGKIPVIQQQRLHDIGQWLKTNGEAIYSSRKWTGADTNNLENVYFTVNNNKLYVICTEYPEKPFTIDQISSAGPVELLGFNGKIKTRKSGNKLTIHPPEITPASFNGQHAWVFKINSYK